MKYDYKSYTCQIDKIVRRLMSLWVTKFMNYKGLPFANKLLYFTE